MPPLRRLIDPTESSLAPLIVALLLVLAAAAPMPAQGAELSRLLDSTVHASQVPAIAAAIVTRDSVLVYDARGIRRKDDPTPVTRDDRFEIGSNTKAMTAGLVGLLVDEGRITWDATLADLFPALATRMRPEYRRVTVRGLLTHHSGLVRDPSGDFGFGPPATPDRTDQPWGHSDGLFGRWHSVAPDRELGLSAALRASGTDESFHPRLGSVGARGAACGDGGTIPMAAGYGHGDVDPAGPLRQRRDGMVGAQPRVSDDEPRRERGCRGDHRRGESTSQDLLERDEVGVAGVEAAFTFA